MSISSWGAKTNYLEAYSEICSAENVVSRRISIILIGILVPVIQFAAYSGAITRLYMSIYEKMERCSIEGRNEANDICIEFDMGTI